HAADTGVSPLSVRTRFAEATVSVFRNSSSSPDVISAFLMPALAQPSSDFWQPAPDDGFWWRERVIFAAADTAASEAIIARGLRRTARRDSTSRILCHFNAP